MLSHESYVPSVPRDFFAQFLRFLSVFFLFVFKIKGFIVDFRALDLGGYLVSRALLRYFLKLEFMSRITLS